MITNLILAMELSTTIATAKPSFAISKEANAGKRFEYSFLMVEAADKHGIDPYLVAAVMWVESNFLNHGPNSTWDYGLMQVHWQKAPWMKGITRKDLGNPAINIRVGVAELAAWRAICRRRGHRASSHNWWGHYQQGNVIKSKRYDRAVNRRYRKLLRSRAKNST